MKSIDLDESGDKRRGDATLDRLRKTLQKLYGNAPIPGLLKKYIASLRVARFIFWMAQFLPGRKRIVKIKKL